MELAIFAPQENFLNCPPPTTATIVLCRLDLFPSPGNQFSDSMVTSLGNQARTPCVPELYPGPSPSFLFFTLLALRPPNSRNDYPGLQDKGNLEAHHPRDSV